MLPGGVAHTLRASRPPNSMAAVCGAALSLRRNYVQAPEGASDCRRCATFRDGEEWPGEKIERGVTLDLYKHCAAREGD